MPNQSGIVRAAQDIAALAGHHAEQAEADRRLSDAVVEALKSAGFGGHFVAPEHGGGAGTFAELSTAVTTIARQCPATAWCAALAASLARMAGYLPEEGRKQVWHEGTDVLIVGGVTPTGRASAQQDGWLLSGTWSYISAADHADWALVCGVVATGTERSSRLFALPRGSYDVRRTWSDVGMRATGSDTLVAEDLFVPANLSVALADVFAGTAPDSVPGFHRLPLTAVNGLFFCLPILGAAEGALELWSAYAAQKITSWTPQQPGPGRSFYEETLARTSGATEAARLLLERAAATVDRGAQITPLECARNQRDTALAADSLVGAVNQLFRASGTAGHSVQNPLQRLWRDVNSAAGHVVLQPGPSATAYTAAALALDT